MQSGPLWNAVQAVYSVVNSALWAFAIAIALWALFNIPTIMQSQRAAGSLLILELVNESRTYCEKWGMKVGSIEHARCLQDLQEIRDKHAKRILTDVF